MNENRIKIPCGYRKKTHYYTKFAIILEVNAVVKKKRRRKKEEHRGEKVISNIRRIAWSKSNNFSIFSEM